jgi:hypothetical protein
MKEDRAFEIAQRDRWIDLTLHALVLRPEPERTSTWIKSEGQRHHVSRFAQDQPKIRAQRAGNVIAD